MWLDLVLCLLAFAAGAGLQRLKNRRLKEEVERLNRLMGLVRAALHQSERAR